MANKEVAEELAEIRKLAKKISKSKKAAKEFLLSTGVYTKTGRLRKPYIRK